MNFEDFESKHYYLELFSDNFRDYCVDNPELRTSLPSLVSSELGVGNKTIGTYVSKLRNQKPFQLVFKKEESYRRLCVILDNLDQTFVDQNLSYLFLAESEFETYYRTRK